MNAASVLSKAVSFLQHSRHYCHYCPVLPLLNSLHLDIFVLVALFNKEDLNYNLILFPEQNYCEAGARISLVAKQINLFCDI